MPLNCSGLLRVCNDGESPGGQCRPNALGRKTVRLRSANWRSALYNVWLAQVFRELDVWSDVDLRSEVDATDFDVEQAADTSRPPSRIGDRAVEL